MEIRMAYPNEIKRIMEIIQDAKESLAQRQVDQWQDGYPNRETFLADVGRGESWVLEEGGQVAATACLGLGREPTYDIIYEGAWGTEAPEYAFLHRIAVSGACKGKGVPSLFFQELERQARERGLPCLRGDTHRENKIMQRVMEKNGLSYRGVIYLEDGGERLAFEKVL